MENIDSDNPQLDVHLAAHLAVAEQENMSRSDNIRWGLRTGSEQGTTKLYNKNCYGYTHDNSGNLIIKEDEDETVRLIFRLYLDGYSVLGITKQLKVRHIKSPTGKDEWNKRYIEKLLNNVKYVGDVALNVKEDRFIYSDHHPAIISREAFDAVQVQQSL